MDYIYYRNLLEYFSNNSKVVPLCPTLYLTWFSVSQGRTPLCFWWLRVDANQPIVQEDPAPQQTTEPLSAPYLLPDAKRCLAAPTPATTSTSTSTDEDRPPPDQHRGRCYYLLLLCWRVWEAPHTQRKLSPTLQNLCSEIKDNEF